jgi:hypothetical protein
MRRDGGIHPRELKSTAGQLAVVSGKLGRANLPRLRLRHPWALLCVASTPHRDVGPWGARTRFLVGVTHGGRVDQPARLDKTSTALESVKAGWPNGPALAAFRVALAQPPSWRGWVMALPAPWTLC